MAFAKQDIKEKENLVFRYYSPLQRWT